MLPAPPQSPALAVGTLYGYLLGMLPVNAVSSTLYMGTGVLGLAAWATRTRPVGYLRLLAVVYGVLAVLGLLSPTDTLLGAAPLYGMAAGFHGVVALMAAYFGFRVTTTAGHAERRRNAMDRRQRAVPVAGERRHGAYDRRHADYGGGTLAAG